MAIQTIQDIRNDILRMSQLVSSQLRGAIEAFTNLDQKKAGKILDSDDIINSINLSISDRANAAGCDLDEAQTRFLNSAIRVSMNLERIGDAAARIAGRVNIALREGAAPIPFDLENMESIAQAAIKESVEAYLNSDLPLVEKACLREPEQDEVFKKKLVEIQHKMRESPDNITFMLYWNSIIKYLEKVTDYTLNIGEQVIYLVTGRRLKFYQYQQLDHVLPREDNGASRFQPYYDGISGAVVARVEAVNGNLIYKEGNKSKIENEAAKLERWQQIMPGITPKVINTFVLGDRETLIREYVAGKFLSELYFSDSELALKEEATRQLMKVTTDIWRLTLKPEKPQFSYISEIRERLDEVYSMHPYLEFMATQEKLSPLLEKAGEAEALLAPAFSVWLHGDFNANNIIYHNGQIKFIDVHRSHFGDYLADIGVLYVSTIRPANLSERVRQDMERVRQIIMTAVQDFRQANPDENQEKRFDLSLARNYITSARTIMDRPQAYWLFQQGVEILKARFG